MGSQFLTSSSFNEEIGSTGDETTTTTTTTTTTKRAGEVVANRAEVSQSEDKHLKQRSDSARREKKSRRKQKKEKSGEVKQEKPRNSKGKNRRRIRDKNAEAGNANNNPVAVAGDFLAKNEDVSGMCFADHKDTEKRDPARCLKESWVEEEVEYEEVEEYEEEVDDLLDEQEEEEEWVTGEEEEEEEGEVEEVEEVEEVVVIEEVVELEAEKMKEGEYEYEYVVEIEESTEVIDSSTQANASTEHVPTENAIEIEQLEGSRATAPIVAETPLADTVSSMKTPSINQEDSLLEKKVKLTSCAISCSQSHNSLLVHSRRRMS